MKNITYQIFLVVVIFFTYQLHSQSIVITGKVDNKPLDTLLLIKAHQDLRYNGEKIPISKNNTFTYSFENKHIEEYSIVFQSEFKTGIWKPIIFFTDSDTLFFDLSSEENHIYGSNLISIRKEYQDKLLEQFNERMNTTLGVYFRSEKESEMWKSAKLKAEKLMFEVADYQTSFFRNSNEILGYYEYISLIKQFSSFGLNINNLKEFHKYWTEKFIDHAITNHANNVFTSNVTLDSSKIYIDFSCETAQGSIINFSTHLENSDYTLLNLWAPWCSPCLSKNKILNENIDTLKAKGLLVFSVMGGINEEYNFKKTLRNKNYNWATYLEINDKNQIWVKYSVDNSGGGHFLFDREGNLLKVNPTLEELKSIFN